MAFEDPRQFEIDVDRLYTAGMTLSRTVRWLDQYGRDYSVDRIVQRWLVLKRKFRHSSVPMWFTLGESGPGVTSMSHQEKQRMLSAPTGSSFAGGTSYGDWKGITGPGKQLRELLKDGET